MNKLVWSQFNSLLIHNLQQYQAEEKFCDTTVVCEGQYFQLHKVILSTCSDYFEDIFNKTPCKHPFIVLKDITPKQFKLILDFIYKGEVEISQNELNKFLDIARGLKLRGINTATVLTTEKSCENEEAGIIYNTVASSSPDNNIVDVVKHAKSFKKKRKLDDDNISRHSDEEDDVHLEFLHTKSKISKNKKYEKSSENSNQNKFEISIEKDQHKCSLNMEDDEADIEIITIKDENFSLDPEFDSQVLRDISQYEEEYLECCEALVGNSGQGEYAMGIAGCNKIGDPSYMDGGGDKLSKKYKERQDISKSSNDPIPRTSSTERKKTSRNLVRDSGFYDFCNFQNAQEKVDREKKRLRNAQHIKDCTSRNLQRIINSDINGKTMEIILSIKRESDDMASICLFDAKERLKRAEENLEKRRIKIGGSVQLRV